MNITTANRSARIAEIIEKRQPLAQGKSTLLQTLSGLSDDEIPSRSGKACTFDPDAKKTGISIEIEPL